MASEMTGAAGAPASVTEAPVTAPGRVRFGDREDQDMPAEWAERMLIAWHKKAPAQFGRYLMGAATDAPARKS